MNNLSAFAVSFCSSCILLGFLYMLCPAGSMEKSVKYVFCLCFLCCVLGCVTNLKSIDLSAFDTTSKSEIITEQSASITVGSLRRRVELQNSGEFDKIFVMIADAQALTDKNIDFKKITVDTNKLSDGSITISRVTVYTCASAEQIIQAIGSDSYEVNVINE